MMFPDFHPMLAEPYGPFCAGASVFMTGKHTTAEGGVIEIVLCAYICAIDHVLLKGGGDSL